MVSAGAVSTRSVTNRAGCTPLPPKPNSAVMLLLPLPLLLLLMVGLLTGLPSMLVSGGLTQSYARTCNVPYSSLLMKRTGAGHNGSHRLPTMRDARDCQILAAADNRSDSGVLPLSVHGL